MSFITEAVPSLADLEELELKIQTMFAEFESKHGLPIVEVRIVEQSAKRCVQLQLRGHPMPWG